MASFAQADVTSAGVATVSLGSAPANGDTVSITVARQNVLTGVTVQDSNGVNLTQQVLADPGSGTRCAIYDYVVSGSPTATFTCSVVPAHMTIYDMVGVGAGSYAQNNAAAVGTSMVATLGSCTTGDLQIGMYHQSTASTGNVTSAFSNGTTVNDSATTVRSMAHGVAASGTTPTFTASNCAGSGTAGLVYANYYGGEAGTPMPWAGVSPGGMPGMP